MTRRDDKGRLGLKSERLRQLTGLSEDEMGRVAGGTEIGDVMVSGATMLNTVDWPGSAGRARSRTCYS